MKAIIPLTKSHSFPKGLRKFPCPRVNTSFIDSEQLAIAHQPATGYHCRAYLVPIHTKDQVPGKIPTAKRCRRQVVEQNEVSGGANTQFAHTREIITEWAKDGIHDAGIMLKCQVQNQVCRHSPWIFECQFVKKVRSFHLLHHVHTKPIVAQTDIYSRANHLFNRRSPHGVVHIRAGVMHTIRMSLSQATNFITAHMYTVRSNAAWS